VAVTGAEALYADTGLSRQPGDHPRLVSARPPGVRAELPGSWRTAAAYASGVPLTGKAPGPWLGQASA
jgi:hypothetical protein